MIKIFKNYMLNLLVVTTFIFSQAVSANANYSSQKENISDYVTPQVENTTSIATNATAFYVPAVNHTAESSDASEGKVEKVVEPVTIGLGILFAGYAISFILGVIKDITSIFRNTH
ncbi:hypothetical protein ABID39_000429 [Bartonella japonica]|uniref:Uncharacterized protein n=1 Tax=Bartonella japonica TaxID=357761 RepID=A0ABV2FML0_9HYPH